MQQTDKSAVAVNFSNTGLTIEANNAVKLINNKELLVWERMLIGT